MSIACCPRQRRWWRWSKPKSTSWNIVTIILCLTVETRDELLTCLVTYSRTEGEAIEERRREDERLTRLHAHEKSLTYSILD
jgi:hypothetical protein